MKKLVVYCIMLVTLGLLVVSPTLETQTGRLLFAATPPATPEVVPDPKLIAEDYPKVDGSTSADPLQIVIACKLLGIPWKWNTDRIDIERRIVAEPGANTQAAATMKKIVSNTTHQAYVNLINGQADIILVARLPSDDELKAAKEQKVELDIKPVALDAFVFLLNTENPLNSLTLDNIRDIYSGKVADWSKLGGLDAPIKPFQREENSGSQELLKALVMKDLPIIQAPDMILLGMGGPFNTLRSEKNGIGYSVYYYTTLMFPSSMVKIIGINKIAPTAETIGNRTYPLTAEVYVIVRRNTSPTSTAMMLRDWLLSKDGQATVASSGYIPVLKQESPSTPQARQ